MDHNVHDKLALRFRDTVVLAARTQKTIPLVLMFSLAAGGVYRWVWQRTEIDFAFESFFSLFLAFFLGWTALIARATWRSEKLPFTVVGTMFMWGCLFVFTQGNGGKALWMLLPCSLLSVALFDTHNKQEGSLSSGLKARAGSIASILASIVYTLLFGVETEDTLYAFGFVARACGANAFAVIVFSSLLRNLHIAAQFAVPTDNSNPPEKDSALLQDLHALVLKRELAMCIYFGVAYSSLFVLSSLYLVAESPDAPGDQYLAVLIPSIGSVFMIVMSVAAYFIGTRGIQVVRSLHLVAGVALGVISLVAPAGLLPFGFFFLMLWAAPRRMLIPVLVFSLVIVIFKTQIPYQLTRDMVLNLATGLIVTAFIVHILHRFYAGIESLTAPSGEFDQTPTATPATQTPAARATFIRPNPETSRLSLPFFLGSLIIFSVLGLVIFRVIHNSSAIIHIGRVERLVAQLHEQLQEERAKVGFMEFALANDQYFENLSKETFIAEARNVSGQGSAYISIQNGRPLTQVLYPTEGRFQLSEAQLSSLVPMALKAWNNERFEALVASPEGDKAPVVLLSSLASSFDKLTLTNRPIQVLSVLSLFNPASPIGAILQNFARQENGSFSVSPQPRFRLIDDESYNFIRYSTGELTHFSLALLGTSVAFNFFSDQDEFIVHLRNAWIVPLILTLSLVSTLILDTISKAINDRQEREKAIALANAEVANGLVRSRFFAKLSHEIRTPLNGIIGMTRLALQNRDAQEVTRFLNSINASGEVLIQLVNDILDFSKLEEGKFDFYHESFYVKEVIETASEIIHSQAQAKNIRLQVSTPLSTRPVIGDSNRVLQILLNLLSNAVKFSYYDSVVTIDAKETLTNDSRIELLFSIRDTGIGIPSEKVNLLFEPFSQIKSTMGKAHSGTGLGLSICKQLAEGMGGSIWVESTYGAGSTFFVRLLLELESDSSSAVNLSKQEREEALFENAKHALRGKNILIVDDNTINLEILRLMLNAEGITTVLARDGAEAVQTVRANLEMGAKPFDAVLMDLQMPEMDGVEAMSHIRRLDHCHSLPIIALSANIVANEKELLTKKGFVDCLQKPASLRTLFIVLQTHIA